MGPGVLRGRPRRDLGLAHGAWNARYAARQVRYSRPKRVSGVREREQRRDAERERDTAVQLAAPEEAQAAIREIKEQLGREGQSRE